jgi:hypothetical protein
MNKFDELFFFEQKQRTEKMKTNISVKTKNNQILEFIN